MQPCGCTWTRLEDGMRVAALYDVHGNAPALEAVLRDLEQEAVDLLLIGGDVVSGPHPREVLGLLRDQPRPLRWVQGNADRELVDVLEGRTAPGPTPGPSDGWVAAQLAPADRDLLASFEETVRLEL